MTLKTYDSLPDGAAKATSIPAAFIAAAAAAMRGVWSVVDGAAVLDQARIVGDEDLVYSTSTLVGDAMYKARNQLAKALDLDRAQVTSRKVKTVEPAPTDEDPDATVEVWRFVLALVDGAEVTPTAQPEDLIPKTAPKRAPRKSK